MTNETTESTWKPILVLTGLLVLFVGPMFGPVGAYAKEEYGVRGGTGVVVGLFTVMFLLLAIGMLRWLRSRGETLADLGWGAPTRTSAVIVAVLFGVFWAGFNIMGYVHQIDKTADPMELSMLRVGTALGGVVIACCEDVLTRGFVMNHLKKMGAGRWRQVWISSAIFALYHSLWTLSIAGFIMGFILGLIFAGFFIWGRRSLTPVIVAHGLCLFLGEPFLTMFMLAAG